MAVAAALVAVVSLVSVQQAANSPDPLDYISSEIAMNQNKHLAVGVGTQDVSLLRTVLNKLDFMIKLPAHIGELQLVMVGGAIARYMVRLLRKSNCAGRKNMSWSHCM